MQAQKKNGKEKSSMIQSGNSFSSGKHENSNYIYYGFLQYIGHKTSDLQYTYDLTPFLHCAQ